MQVIRNTYKSRRISYEDDAYNLPLDTVYFIESSWNYKLNEYVYAHRHEIEQVLGNDIGGFFTYKFEIVSLSNLKNPSVQEAINKLHPELSIEADFSKIPELPETEKERVYQSVMMQRLRSKQPVFEDTFIARVIPRDYDDTYDFYSIDISLCTETLVIELLEKYVCNLNHINLSIFGENDFWRNYGIQDEVLQIANNQSLGRGIVSFCGVLPQNIIIKNAIGNEIENLKITSQLRDLALRMKNEVDSYQRDNGINVLLEDKFAEFIKSFENFDVKPLSNLEINSTFNIRLIGYEKEIKMHTFPKAVYIFFLRHPQGIYLKDISNHRDELFTIYRTLDRHGFSPDETYAKIDGLLDLTNGILNQYICRISEAFRKELSADLAKNYIVSGKRNEIKRILMNNYKVILPEKLKF